MLPEEVAQFIGKPMGSSVFEIQEEAIRRFADAVDDPNPLYWDEEYAKKSKYGAIIAPPGFISSPWFSDRPTKWPGKSVASSEAIFGLSPALTKALAKAGYSRLLDGGIEYEFFKQILAGDIITSSTIIKDIIGRESAAGKTAFLITETTYIDQKGELVAKARSTLVNAST
jgi:acyl dehydratase